MAISIWQYLLGQNLQLLETFPNHSDILDCTEDNRVVLRQKRQEGDYMLSIWKLGSQQPVMTLQPTAGRTWGPHLSVCCMANRIVVVNRWNQTMDIFTQAGKMHQSV